LWPQRERLSEPAPIEFPHRIQAERGSEMEQLTLDVLVAPENEPVIVLDPRLREKLIALMKGLVMAVHEAGKEENDDGLS